MSGLLGSIHADFSDVGVFAVLVVTHNHELQEEELYTQTALDGGAKALGRRSQLAEYVMYLILP